MNKMAVELFSWCNSDVTWILTILLGYYIFYQFILKTWWYFEQRDVKYVRGMPIIGSRYRAILAIDNERDTLQSLYSAYADEPFIGVYDLFGRPSYIIRDLYLVKQLSATTSVYPKKESSLYATKATQADQAVQTKKFFAATNDADGVNEEIASLISDCAKDFCDSLLAKQFNGINTNEYEAKDLFGRYASNVIGWSALGNRVNTLDPLNITYYRTCCAIANWRCVQKSRLCDYLNLDAIKHFVNTKIVGDKDELFFRAVVERKIQKRLASDVKHGDMIDYVIRNAQGNKTIVPNRLLLFLYC